MRALNLKQKMVLTVSLLVIVLMAAMALLGLGYFNRQSRSTMVERQNQLVSLVADDLDEHLAATLDELADIAASFPLAALADPDEAQRLLDARGQTESTFDNGMFLLSREGRLIAETPYRPVRRGVDYSYREYFKLAMTTGKPVVYAPYISSQPHRHPAIMFAVPLLARDGRVAAVLAGSVDLTKNNYLLRLARVKVGKSGYLYIYSADRYMIVHPESGRIGRRDVLPGMNGLYDRAIAGFEGSGETVNSRGVRSLSTFKRLKNANWIVAATLPIDEAQEPITKAADYFRKALAMVVVITALVVWLSLRMLTTPLRRLTRHVAGLPEKAGDDRFFTATSNDEIGQLAQAFNRMLEDLDRQKAELEKSRALYRTVADFSTDMAVWRGPDSKMAYISPNCVDITGYRDEEFYADPQLLDRLIHGDDFSLWQEHRHGLGGNPEHDPLELRIVAKSGELRWLSHRCREVYEHAEFLGVRGSFHDITRRKRLELELAERTGFAESLIKNAVVPIFVIDASHRVIIWNRACEELTGIREEEVKGTTRQWAAFYPNERPTLADIVIDGSQEDVATYYRAFSKSPLIADGLEAEGWYESLGGRRRYIYFDAAPVRNSSGELVAVVETLQDITERRESEEQLRKLSRAVEQSPSIIMITDMDGRVEYVNPTFTRVTGYPAAEILGLNANMLDGHTPDDERELWAKLRAEGEWHGEFYNRKKAGGNYWEHANITAIRDSEGEATHFLKVAEDITARKIAERELNKSKAELTLKHEQLRVLFSQVERGKKEWEDTFDCISDLLILADSDGRIRRCNWAVAELVSREYGEIIGSDWRELILTEEMDASRFNGQAGDLFHRPTKRWFYCNVYAAGNRGNSTLSGMVVTLHDTTEIKIAADALEQAYAELKSAQSQMLQREKMASIGQLAAGVAHEINNPIGFVNSNIGTLGKYMEKLNSFIASQGEILEAHSDQQAREELAAIRKRLKIDYVVEDIGNLIAESLDGTERVRKIVQDLKSFSRVDEAEYKMADILHCLESTINIAWNELKYKVTLHKEYADLPETRCYPQQLNQVFMNLLVNAAHAIEKNGEVTIRTWVANRSIFVSITDTGCGIPPEIQARIFEPFFTTKEVGKGTGLGLSISYDIIKKHGGDLTVASEVGVGTTFTLRIPVVEG